MRRNVSRYISLLLVAVTVFGLLPAGILPVRAADSAPATGLAGKALSILGDSISTYTGYSNGTAAQTTNSTISGVWSGMLLAENTVSENYLFKSYTSTGLLALGSNYQHYGIALAEQEIDLTQARVFRLENRIALRSLNSAAITPEDLEATGVTFYAPGEVVPVQEGELKFEDVGTVGSWQDAPFGTESSWS